ncbi:MAG: kelch repeat-containing protein [Calditrichia bacterium]
MYWNSFVKNGVKIYLWMFLILFVLSFVVGCSNDEDEEDIIGNWVELSDFEGVARSDAVVFTIGNKAYVGTGYDGTDRLRDLWEYDPELNNWTRKADFPGVPRSGAVGFGTDSKGYVGLGYDGTNKLKDFWEYDPVTNKWDSIPEFGGSARYSAVAFSINNKGYVGTGYDGNNLKDFWEYDPATKKWTQIISLPGAKRRDAVAFVIDGKAYICTGVNNGTYEDDLWEYDPATQTWSKKRDISDKSDDEYDDEYYSIVGANKVAFAINGKGYVVTGGQGTAGTYTWEYDPKADLWTEKTALEASGRIEAVGFALGDMGYVATGRTGSYYLDDLWGFRPNVEQVDFDKPGYITSP